jgi:hypothetical protein
MKLVLSADQLGDQAPESVAHSASSSFFTCCVSSRGWNYQLRVRPTGRFEVPDGRLEGLVKSNTIVQLPRAGLLSLTAARVRQ